MKAFFVDRYDKTTPLRLADVPDPVVGDRDVLVDIHAAALNVLDVKLKAGEFKAIVPYKTPFILGHDVAGTVIAAGRKVRNFKPGDLVYARPRDHRIGAFAEKIAIDEADVALKPNNISMEEAASLPLVALTSWQALVERGKIGKGSKVFIQAGAGGVGTIAIQLAKHLGATVATTAGKSSADLVKSLGADVVIDYQTEDFAKVLSSYDFVLNSQDKATLEKSLMVLKSGGKLVSISGPPDPPFAREIGANWVIRLVVSLLSRSVRSKARRRGVDYSFLFMKASGDQLRRIATLVESGAIRPVIDRVFPFDAANEAMAYVEKGRAKGKVVLKVK